VGAVILIAFVAGGCTVPAELKLAKPVPENQRFEVSADQLWKSVATPPAGWSSISRDEDAKFVTHAVALDKKLKPYRKPREGTLPRGSGGTLAISLLVVPRGERAAELMIQTRAVGLRGQDEFLVTTGNVERALLDTIGARLKRMGATP